MKKLLFILLTLSLNSFGQTAEDYYNKGISKFNKKNYKGAISKFNKTIILNPNYADAYINRGIAKKKTLDYSGAIADYNKAIQLNPNYADAYNNRGDAKYQLEDYTGACKDWTKAGELGSANALTNIKNYCKQVAVEYYGIGIMHLNIKDYTGAIVDYNKAIQLNPNYADAYNNRGVAKHNLQDYSGAIADYNKAIQLKPDYADVYNNRGNAKTYLNDWAGAISDYNKVIQLNPDYADVYYADVYNNSGIAKHNLQDYTGAIADYNKVIQLKPDHANAYKNRGNAKTYINDWAGACKDWTKAGELGFSVALTAEQKKYCELQDVLKFSEVKIGTQIWSNKNLDVSTYRNGDPIPEVQDKTAWANLTTGAWCYYENKTSKGSTYGKLYNWHAVNDPRGLAPKGYHIPTDEEWTILTDYLGGKYQGGEAGTKMKSTSGWRSYILGGGYYNKPCPNCADWSSEYRRKNSCHKCKDNQVIPAYYPGRTHLGDGTNTSGFAGLPGGIRISSDDFYSIGAYGAWWSSSEFNTDKAWFRSLHNDYGNVYRNANDKRDGLSVRCLRD